MQAVRQYPGAHTLEANGSPDSQDGFTSNQMANSRASKTVLLVCSFSDPAFLTPRPDVRLRWPLNTGQSIKRGATLSRSLKDHEEDPLSALQALGAVEVLETSFPAVAFPSSNRVFGAIIVLALGTLVRRPFTLAFTPLVHTSEVFTPLEAYFVIGSIPPLSEIFWAR